DYDYVVLLNSDVEVTEGWWQPLLKYMESNPEAGALQPKIRSYRNRDYFEYAGAAGGFLDRLGYPYCRGRVLGKIEKDEGQYDGEPAEVTWASGAALMVRVKAYREVGGLDERFFAHMEEIDLCCRMIAAGYKVMALSDSVVFHVGGASLEQGNPKKTYLNFRNNLLLLYKNLPAKRGRRLIFIRRLADTLAWGMFVVKGDWKNAKAVLKAHSDYRKMKKYYRSATSDKLPLSRRLIMLSYF
ncbi:MAG: glycosyltransferase family 2 protein, partial [Muribaculaceae bacterium]|nr:glycosyltransferase family 2 protein [Muribaculaceae bacterium]